MSSYGSALGQVLILAPYMSIFQKFSPRADLGWLAVAGTIY
jgi:hypothetical protein